MPNFRLRKIPDEENTYRVVLQLEDGYELRVGAVREQVGSGMHHFWSWSIGVMRPVLGRFGQADTREEAMGRFRAAWESIATADDIAEIRRDADWTDQKYALWAAGKRARWRPEPFTAHAAKRSILEISKPPKPTSGTSMVGTIDDPHRNRVQHRHEQWRI